MRNYDNAIDEDTETQEPAAEETSETETPAESGAGKTKVVARANVLGYASGVEYEVDENDDEVAANIANGNLERR